MLAAHEHSKALKSFQKCLHYSGKYDMKMSGAQAHLMMALCHIRLTEWPKVRGHIDDAENLLKSMPEEAFTRAQLAGLLIELEGVNRQKDM